jgi:hypothetical protein
VRTRFTSNGSQIDGYVCREPAPAGLVATSSIVVMLLAEGSDVVHIARATGWPARQVRLLGSRHGYLFAADGTAYQPPAHAEQPRRRPDQP